MNINLLLDEVNDPIFEYFSNLRKMLKSTIKFNLNFHYDFNGLYWLTVDGKKISIGTSEHFLKIFFNVKDKYVEDKITSINFFVSSLLYYQPIIIYDDIISIKVESNDKSFEIKKKSVKTIIDENLLDNQKIIDILRVKNVSVSIKLEKESEQVFLYSSHNFYKLQLQEIVKLSHLYMTNENFIKNIEFLGLDKNIDIKNLLELLNSKDQIVSKIEKNTLFLDIILSINLRKNSFFSLKDNSEKINADYNEKIQLLKESLDNYSTLNLTI